MSQIIYIHPQKYLSSTTGAEKSSEANWQSPVPKPGYTPILKADLPTLRYSLQKFLTRKSTSHRLSPNDNSKTGEQNDGSGPTPNHKSLTSAASVNSSPNINGAEDGKDGAISVLYRPIGQFLPLTLRQQLLTVAIRGIPASVTNQKVEKFLLDVLKLIRTDDSSGCLIDGWTNVVSPGLDIQEVYIRFSGWQILQNQNMSTSKSSSEKGDTTITEIAKNMKFFIDLFTNSELLSVHTDENSHRFVEDFCAKTDYKAPDSDVANKFQDLVNTILSPTNQSDSKSGDVVRNTGTSNTNESDDTIEYHVDLSKLGDIPRDFLAQLCRDIVEFRTRVITIEREKLARESYLESVRRREQVMRIFEKIRRSKSGHKSSRDGDQNDSGSKEVEGDDNEFDSVEAIDDAESVDDDYAVEQARIFKEKRESEVRYENLLRNFNTVIEPRIRLLRSDIERARNYETSLLEDRSRNLKEIVNLGRDPYYDSRRSYKEMEEELDAVDREKHGDQDKYVLEAMKAASKAQEINLGKGTGMKTTEDKLTENSQATTTTATGGISIKFSLKKAADKMVTRTTDTDYQVAQEGEKPEENEQETGEPEATGDDQGTREITDISSANSILQFSDADLSSRLQKLRESRFVDELVNEYLGVYEDELVEFIFENIAENKSRQVLLDDLRETFDNDAEIMVDKIWSREELQ